MRSSPDLLPMALGMAAGQETYGQELRTNVGAGDFAPLKPHYFGAPAPPPPPPASRGMLLPFEEQVKRGWAEVGHTGVVWRSGKDRG